MSARLHMDEEDSQVAAQMAAATALEQAEGIVETEVADRLTATEADV